jgi:uncharacterized protein YyaL (SSP411 family)
VAAGRPDEALPLAEEIVDLIAALEDPAVTFDALVDAAAVYAANERLDAARKLLQRAITESDDRGAWGYAAQAREAILAVDEAAAVDTPR